MAVRYFATASSAPFVLPCSAAMLKHSRPPGITGRSVNVGKYAGGSAAVSAEGGTTEKGRYGSARGGTFATRQAPA